MEQLLHYAWKHKIFSPHALRTTTGEAVEVMDTGRPNPSAGPGFFNARIKIGGLLWAGNVEIHPRSSDWFRHGHHRDARYDSVVLHLAAEIDADIHRSNGERIPQARLECPPAWSENYRELLAADRFPACRRILPSLSPFAVHAWMSALQTERFGQKAALLAERADRCGGNWNDTFFVTLARNFGFGTNGDAFETWALHLPLRAVDKHRDDLFRVEAFFFGQAGLLPETPAGDAYFLRLQKEYAYLSHKFGLKVPASLPRLFRPWRPGNAPHTRIARLAALYHRADGLLSRILEAETLPAVRHILKADPSDYWLTHHTFNGGSSSRPKTRGTASPDLLVINTVVPFLYACGLRRSQAVLCDRAGRFLEELKPENNRVTRMWEQCGIPAAHAGDSQALLQLKTGYCDKRRCLHCRFGYEYLKRGAR